MSIISRLSWSISLSRTSFGIGKEVTTVEKTNHLPWSEEGWWVTPLVVRYELRL